MAVMYLNNERRTKVRNKQINSKSRILSKLWKELKAALNAQHTASVLSWPVSMQRSQVSDVADTSRRLSTTNLQKSLPQCEQWKKTSQVKVNVAED